MRHKIGDIVLADLSFDYELGVIVNITEDAFMPYTVRWFNSDRFSHLSPKTISRFKKDFKELLK